MKQTKFNGIYEQRKGKRRNLFTLNLTPGKSVYQERLVNHNGTEFREWDPFKSKLAAAILKGLNQTGFGPGDVVLYLGASTGTTVSHVSDIVGKNGFVFALDFAPRVVRQLTLLSDHRKNMAPILATANQPSEYFHKVLQADMLYQDIAQKNQAEIFLKNLILLKKGGFAILCVKSRSIDITKKPKQIFKQIKWQLENQIKIIDTIILDPFQKDHCMFLCKK